MGRTTGPCFCLSPSPSLLKIGCLVTAASIVGLTLLATWAREKW